MGWVERAQVEGPVVGRQLTCVTLDYRDCLDLTLDPKLCDAADQRICARAAGIETEVDIPDWRLTSGRALRRCRCVCNQLDVAALIPDDTNVVPSTVVGPTEAGDRDAGWRRVRVRGR